MSGIADSLRKIMPTGAFRTARAMATAVVTPVRFARATGHWRSSLAEKAMTRGGEPLPWYTYPAIDFLAARDFSDKSVLEFGGGQSTLFWCRRARSVVTIEEDRAWYGELKPRLPANAELHHVPADRQSRDVGPIRDILQARGQSYDIIVVDGHLRQECTALAFAHLSPRGAIVLDNAEGYGFFEETKGRDCRRIDFYGFTPGVSRQHCTSLAFVGDCFLLDPMIPIRDITRG